MDLTVYTIIFGNFFFFFYSNFKKNILCLKFKNLKIKYGAEHKINTERGGTRNEKNLRRLKNWTNDINSCASRIDGVVSVGTQYTIFFKLFIF